MRKKNNAHRILVLKHMGKRLLGRPIMKGEGNINVDLMEKRSGDGTGSGSCPLVDLSIIGFETLNSAATLFIHK
jgi:hypothetical protein